ncbi:MAG: hypothetical protein DHS20C18_14000 [Saprospiraceae bacterium]|nr:MAG: hypothetical protein DHS20C18_14000 [Saprospiraceae bacterium]
MKRRDILKYTALATGAALGAPLMSSLLVSCQSDVTSNDLEGNLQFFNQEEYAMVKDLVDLILPKTDSPSASDVGVHKTIDHMVGAVYNEKDRAAYKTGFTTLTNHLNQANFQKLDNNSRTSLLKDLDLSEDDELKAVCKAFLTFKQQTIAYYLSTEEVGTQFLNFLPVPGKYEPCITVEEAGGKAWAI